MIFKQWAQILDGTKTQTRRPVKRGLKTDRWWWYESPEYGLDTKGLGSGLANEIHAVYRPDGRLRWHVGHDYAVQPGRGQKAVGRIRINRIRRERLQYISEKDCEAEGIGWTFTDDGDVLWWSHTDWGPSISPQIAFANEWDSIYKKPYRWEDNPDVWVLEFESAEREAA